MFRRWLCASAGATATMSANKFVCAIQHRSRQPTRAALVCEWKRQTKTRNIFRQRTRPREKIDKMLGANEHERKIKKQHAEKTLGGVFELASSSSGSGSGSDISSLLGFSMNLMRSDDG